MAHVDIFPRCSYISLTLLIGHSFLVTIMVPVPSTSNCAEPNRWPHETDYPMSHRARCETEPKVSPRAGFATMPKTRVVKARDIVKDIRERLDNEELKAKYKLSSDLFQAVLLQLVAIKAVTRAEVFDRIVPSAADGGDEEVKVESLRKLPRHIALFPIPIYDANNSKISGMLRDLNERGVGITGIETSVGENRKFVILGDEFVAVEFDRFTFDAVCRWVRIENDEGPYVSGFEITAIEDKDMQELKKLIMSLSLSET